MKKQGLRSYYHVCTDGNQLPWMFRDDGKVDFGLWTNSDKRDLILPLDVHVYTQATELGLTKRRQKDIVTAKEITDTFREIWPDDPCRGDFALFGYGVTR